MSFLGQNIKKLRQVKGLSQQAFAELFELKRANISSYEEKRAEPKLEFVIKIANYFGIPLNDFIEKPLSVNEILNFGDYFEESGICKSKNLTQIPFLSRENFTKYDEFFSDLHGLPQLMFPVYSKNRLIAVEMNSSLPHHLDFQQTDGSILFFENIDRNNLHLIHNLFGLFWGKDEFFIGKFKISESEISLELNEWKSISLNLKSPEKFWTLLGTFQKI